MKNKNIYFIMAFICFVFIFCNGVRADTPIKNIHLIEPSLASNIIVGYQPAYYQQTQIEKKFSPKLPFNIYDFIRVYSNFSVTLTGNTSDVYGLPEWSLTVEDEFGKQYFDALPWYNTVSVSNDGTKLNVLGYMDLVLASVLSESEQEEIIKAADDGKKLSVVLRIGNYNNFRILDPYTNLIGSAYYVSPRVYDFRDDYGGVLQNWILETPTMEFKKKPLPLTNCVHLYGNDTISKYQFVTMRAESADITPNDMINPSQVPSSDGMRYFNLDVKSAISNKDPFRLYQDRLSFYADLKVIDDSIADVTSDGRYFWAFSPSRLSSCRSLKIGNYFYLFNGNSAPAYTYGDHPDLFFNFYSQYYSIESISHETGHAFCNLEDEYVYPVESVALRKADSKSFGKTNCVFNPLKSFISNGILYSGFYSGNFYRGCTALYNSAFNFIFRSSDESLMNDASKDNRFNVISCSYCLDKLSGKSHDENLKACMQMDTVKPSCSASDPSSCPTGFSCSLQDNLCRKN